MQYPMITHFRKLPQNINNIVLVEDNTLPIVPISTIGIGVLQ